MVPKICSIPECGRKLYARDLCSMHYKRWRKTGEVGPAKSMVILGDDTARFWSKVKKTETCWEWVPVADSSGYARFNVGGRMFLAHRVAYKWANGTIPDEMTIDHICHNTTCVNPAHLRPVTHKQNHENRAGAQSNSRSGVRGVSWHSASGKWRAEVKHNGRTVSVGIFLDLSDAEAAVIAKRNELFTHNDLDRIPA